MARRNKEIPRLLASELEILDALWQRGPATIVEVQRLLTTSPAYSTVQTRLNRLVSKHLVSRGRHRPARYSAAIQPEDVTTLDLKLLVEKVTKGVVPLVAQLVNDSQLTLDEIQELKSLIATAEAQVEESHQDE
jgi:BlaI family penicillinase repressor